MAIAAVAAAIALAIGAGWWLARYSVAVNRLARGVGDTVFYGADGRPWFRLDERRHDVTLDAIAPVLQQAVVAIEDRRFYLHPGVDPIGLTRAAVRDLRSGTRAEGGSTLTMQLARTLFLSNTRTFGRKLREIGLAVLLELRLSKKDILELYLNRVYLSGGVYGVEAMSELLFGKPATRVTLAEAAFIAGLIRAPSALSPWNNYELALERSRLVLAQMRALGYVTPQEADAASRVRPKIAPYRGPTDPRAAWAKDYLRQQFRNQFGGDHPPDWRVNTSFVPALQEAAERAVGDGIRRLRRPALQAALVAMDPATGNILAMVGGADYTRSTFNRAVRARRQPGSAFKPFVFAAALSRGFSPVSLLTGLDNVTSPEDPDWRPTSVVHVDGGTDEPLPDVTLRRALAQSNNAAAVVLQQRVGVRNVLRIAEGAGLSDLPAVPSLALGSGEVTPLDLTAAYTVFPGYGQAARPRGLLSVLDADGTPLYADPIETERVLSPEVAFQMIALLRGVVDAGTGAPARAFGVAGPVGGKTGTTDRYVDAWFVGFSSALVVGVWVGYDQPAPIGANAYGARVALPIWADFMKQAARVIPPRSFPVPPGLRAVALCRVTGLRPVESCPVYTEYFKPGDDIPSAVCPEHDGTFGETATRAIGELLRGLGTGLKGIFKD